MFGPDKLRKCLGRGAQGEVYDTTIPNVAVKILRGLNPIVGRCLFEKVFTASQWPPTDHIVRYFAPGASPDFTEVHLPLSKLSGGSAVDWMMRYADRNKKVPEADVLKFSLGLARGLQFLHDTIRVAHGDVKLDNVMFSDSPGGTAVLIDLETLFLLDPMKCADGTSEYMSPEWHHARDSNVLPAFQPTPNCDVFGLGVTILSLALTTKEPGLFQWASREGGRRDSAGFLSNPEFTPAIIAGIVRHCMQGYNEAFIALVMRMVCHDPGSRPSSAVIVKQLELIGSGRTEELLTFPQTMGPYSFQALPVVGNTAWCDGELVLDLPCPQCGLPLHKPHTCALFLDRRHANLRTTASFDITLPPSHRQFTGVPEEARRMAYVLPSPVKAKMEGEVNMGVTAPLVHSLLRFGGVVYFDDRGTLVGLRGFKPKGAHIFFSQAQSWMAACTPYIASTIHKVYDPFFLGAGAKLQCWIPPGLQVRLPNGQMWSVAEHGACVFFFSEDGTPTNRDVFFEVGVPAIAPLPPPPLFHDALDVSFVHKQLRAELVSTRDHKRPSGVLVEDGLMGKLCTPYTENIPRWLTPYIREQPQECRIYCSHPVDRFDETVGSVIVAQRRCASAYTLRHGHTNVRGEVTPLHFARVPPDRYDSMGVTAALGAKRYPVDVSVLDWQNRGYVTFVWIPPQNELYHGGYVFFGKDNAVKDVYQVVDSSNLSCDASQLAGNSGGPREWVYCFGAMGWVPFPFEDSAALTAASLSMSPPRHVPVSMPFPGSHVDLVEMTLTHDELPYTLCVRHRAPQV